MKYWVSRESFSWSVLVLGVVTLGCLGLSLVHGWNDDQDIHKWSPNFFSAYKYSAPIGIRNRGYLFKRLIRESPNGFRWSPSFLLPPFYLKRTERLVNDLNLPLRNSRLSGPLGWYSGPGSPYSEFAKTEGSDEENGENDFYVE